MTDPTSKKANAYLQTESQDLQKIFAKIHQLEEVNRKVTACLEPSIAKHCQVANWVGTKLIIMAANGSIATQIRFQSADLLKKLRTYPDLQHFETIECKVRPSYTATLTLPAETKAKKMALLSPEISRIVSEIAALLKDQKLRTVMERIAKRTDPHAALPAHSSSPVILQGDPCLRTLVSGKEV